MHEHSHNPPPLGGRHEGDRVPVGDGFGFASIEAVRKERSALITCANAVGLTLLLYLFFRAALPVYVIRFFMLFFPGVRYSNSHLIANEWLTYTINALNFVLAAVVPVLIYTVFLRVPRRVVCPLRRPHPSIVVPAVFLSLGVSVLGTSVGNFIHRLLDAAGLVPLIPSVEISTTPLGLLFTLINVCLLPALVEEFVYRGAIMQSLRRFGDGFAVLLSAVIFSLMHLNVTQLPNAFMMGLVIGYFVVLTGSLWTGFLIHFFNNLLALAQTIALQRLTGVSGEVLNCVVVILYLLLALLATALLARSSDQPLFRLKIMPSAFNLRQKTRMFLSSPAMLIALAVALSITLNSVQRLR